VAAPAATGTKLLADNPVQEVPVKGSEKPKKLAKKQAQKTLKEKRADKKAAASKKFGSS
jgi:hypothetical protein